MTDHVDTETRSLMMAAVRSKDTAPERTVRSIVHHLGYRFRLHRKDLPGTPDIVFPARKIVMFVHGCFWHGHDCPRGSLPSSNVEFWQRKIGKNKERDSSAQERLREDGWQVLTIWECEIKHEGKLEKSSAGFWSAAGRRSRRNTWRFRDELPAHRLVLRGRRNEPRFRERAVLRRFRVRPGRR